MLFVWKEISWCVHVLRPVSLPRGNYSCGSCRAFPDILGIFDHRCILSLFFFLASPHGLWDLSCPARVGNHTPCSGSAVLAFGVPAKLRKNWHLLSIYVVSRVDIVGALLRWGTGRPAAMTTGSWWLTAVPGLQGFLAAKKELPYSAGYAPYSQAACSW